MGRPKKIKPLKKFLVVVTGPTATGKTAAAIHLAKYFKTEIISADSRQFFAELSIGTAQPSPAELKKVKHHFTGNLSVKQDYDAGKFEMQALEKIRKIFARKNIVVMAGGSGMYIDAVCRGFDPLPEGDKELRAELSAAYSEKGIAVLQKLLFELDPKYYYSVDLNNPQRLIRALEICINTGKPYSSFREGKPQKRDFKIIKIGLDMNRDELYARINSRVDEMIKKGLEKEAKSLEKFKYFNALQTVGYKELFLYFEGRISFEEAVEKIKQNTRNFAKRQLTWFRKDKTIKWFGPGDYKKMIRYIEKICAG